MDWSMFRPCTADLLKTTPYEEKAFWGFGKGGSFLAGFIYFLSTLFYSQVLNKRKLLPIITIYHSTKP